MQHSSNTGTTAAGGPAAAASHRRRRRIAAAAGLIAGAMAVLPAPAAQANAYTVWSCKGPNGAVAPTDGWVTLTESSPQFSPAANRCSSGGALEAFVAGDRTQNLGAAVKWSYTPPANTKLRGFSINRSMSSAGVRSNQAPGTQIRVPGVAVDNCYAAFECSAKGSHTQWNASGNALTGRLEDPTHFDVLALCGGSQSCQSFGVPRMAEVRVHRFAATLADDTSPDVQSVGGTLLDGGPQRGLKTISVRASDVGAGVYRALIETKKPGDAAFAVARAITIDANGGRCAPIAGATGAHEFAYGQPCKLSASGDLDFDTSSLDDGQYEMRVSVEDASGNRVTAAAPRTVTVRNAPSSTQPPSVSVPGRIKAGDTLTCNPGTFDPLPDRVEFSWLVAGSPVDGASGSSYTVRASDVGRSIICRVKATKSGQTTTVDSAPVGGTNQPGGPTTNNATSSNATGGSKTSTTNVFLNPANANGRGGLVRTARFTAASKRTKRIRYGQKATIRGQLKDVTGKPIIGAVVDVYSRTSRPGTYLRKVRSVKTNADGIYRYVAPVGVSRAIRFGYRATLSSGRYSAQLDVALKVRAKIRLRAKPKHVRSYGRIKVVGKLYGKGLPAKGALVEMQVRQGGVWRTITVKRTKKRGRFVFRHKLTRTAHGSFTFRARLRNQNGVPLTGGVSKRLKVRVG